MDDLLIFGENQEIMNELLNYLKEVYKDIKVNIGNKHNYLGMELNFNNNKLNISMTGYVDNILTSNNITGQSESPSSLNLFDNNIDEELLNNVQQKQMHRTIAQLLFLCKRSRPDISLVVNYLSS